MNDAMKSMMRAEYECNHVMGRISNESPDEFHKRLEEFFGCTGCDECGNNGCGGWQLGGHEWNSLDENGYGEPEEWTNEDWFCLKLDSEIEYENLKKQQREGILVFSAAIKEAIRLCPDKALIGQSYGDVVRSAAAVAVAAKGKNVEVVS